MNTSNLTPATKTAHGCPPWLPEKFWDEQNGQPRTEALARSYQELENRMGGSAVINVPEHPGAYQINIDDDLLDIDDEVNARLHQGGFTQDQAQLVYDLASERMMPLVAQIAADYENKREQDTLITHFGSAERFQALRPQLRSWGEANLSSSIFENLSASAEGVIAMFEMMQNREPGLMRVADGPTDNSEQDLKRMMKDPRYWKDRDPGYVARVRNGFKTLYPEA